MRPVGSGEEGWVWGAAGAGGEEACGEDAGVVEDEEVALTEVRGEVGEMGVGVGTALAVEHEHAAGAAGCRGMLGDEGLGGVRSRSRWGAWRR